MKTLHFTTRIRANREAVWNTLIAPETYKIWTAEFAEGSDFEGSWAQGERIRFLAPDGNGISSIIAENRPHTFISIKHLGCVKAGIEDMESEDARGWATSFENYSFSDDGLFTELQVDLAVPAEFEACMLQTWPKALSKLKAICESDLS